MVNKGLNFIRSETWRPKVDVTLNNLAMDCTGYDVYIHIKDKVKDKYVHITWITQSNGKGYFDLSHIKSKELNVGNYDYEVVLYKADETFKKVLRKGVLEVTETLDKEIEQR
jgi:hypothetical protein